MDRALALYKSIVDGLAGLGSGVYRNWVLERGAWPAFPENEPINALLSKLDDTDKETLVTVLEEARHGRVHDTLVFFLRQDGV